MMSITVESRKYAALFYILASGKTGEVAYAWDCDISAWQQLPTDDRHVDTRSLYLARWTKLEKNDKVSFDMTYSYPGEKNCVLSQSPR